MNDVIWTPSLIRYLDEAPLPCDKWVLIDYAIRHGAPDQVIENLQMLEEGKDYNNLEEVWEEYETLDYQHEDVDY